VVVANATAPEVAALTEEGEPFWKVTWAAEQEPIQRDEALAYWTRAYAILAADSSAAYRRNRIRELRRRFEEFAGFVATRRPAISQILVDDADRVWVRRFDSRAWPQGLSSWWDLFGSDGRYCGVLETPGIHYVYDVSELGMIGSLRRRKASQELVLVRFVSPIGCDHLPPPPDLR
jgi:hypothetical protein